MSNFDSPETDLQQRLGCRSPMGDGGYWMRRAEMRSKREATSWGYVTKCGSLCLTRVHPCRRLGKPKEVMPQNFLPDSERWVMVAPPSICSSGGVDWVLLWAASQVAKCPLRERIQVQAADVWRVQSGVCGRKEVGVGLQQLATTYMCIHRYMYVCTQAQTLLFLYL